MVDLRAAFTKGGDETGLSGGFWLCPKRSESGRFAWPVEKEPAVALRPEEFMRLAQAMKLVPHMAGIAGHRAKRTEDYQPRHQRENTRKPVK